MTAPDKGTPRTDEVAEWVRRLNSQNAYTGRSDELVSAEFARTLERDALRLAGELERLTESIRNNDGVGYALSLAAKAQAQLAQVTAERDEAREAITRPDALVNSLSKRLSAAESALASREGWQMCPLEPTEEMLAAGTAAWCRNNHGEPYDREIPMIYRAMLAAVKEKPSE